MFRAEVFFNPLPGSGFGGPGGGLRTGKSSGKTLLLPVLKKPPPGPPKPPPGPPNVFFNLIVS